MFKFLGDYSYFDNNGERINTIMLKGYKFETHDSSPNILIYSIENRITKLPYFDIVVYFAGCVNRDRRFKPSTKIYNLEEE